MAARRRAKPDTASGLIPVTVRFSPSQLDAVEAAAESLGIDRAQYIRMGALRECGWVPPKPAAAGGAGPPAGEKKSG